MSDDKPSWAGDQEMRSSIHGTFATFLLLIPVGIIPTLAIFGIPQFAPVVASPLSDGNENEYDSSEANSGNGPASASRNTLEAMETVKKFTLVNTYLYLLGYGCFSGIQTWIFGAS